MLRFPEYVGSAAVTAEPVRWSAVAAVKIDGVHRCFPITPPPAS